ncbi:RING finger domain protein [Tricharina praecox]|uniref:RING finger domain protein n=1 Tax=Tricharina praecox TaxID=43433 RepID=UPI00221E7444|nr:RING finger domain protein [Tricharina praecox]KAI5856011.1 RING finger domain protein [Tricharina praecox]
MDPSAASSAFVPTPEQASFRFTSYRSPTVEDEPEPPRPARTPSPRRPPNTTATDDDLLRKCRICFDTSAPPYEPSPELGRLFSPCVCRGSSRYVHTVCLQTWRATSRTASYTCPTCKYPYRLSRLNYASWLTSTSTTFLATSVLLLLIVWLLGYVSGPILATYLVDVPDNLELPVPRGGWAEHFLRGLASLGLLGFAKVMYIVGPSSWLNMRASGNLGGRERVSRLTWIVIALGVANFFVWLWRRVGGYVKGRMESVAGDVLDVGEGGDGDERVVKQAWSEWAAATAAQAWVTTRNLVGRARGGNPEV